ncbi:hypothetical protein K491DRAFT_716236 [Lophiostoma macrostomum CBS 122681]|uniref:Uncharacterized protein n=1 Tax=Lophiostoma macrostomum CBS 122681 TaxID=1314788 RepID=A0A6A6T866_9PLEO|nr:hypothetical protein K491DRAFT_716236 [Lophiostoma macrostomum CBS 122681]
MNSLVSPQSHSSLPLLVPRNGGGPLESSSQPTSTPPETATTIPGRTLLTLPGEIRFEIYKHVLPTNLGDSCTPNNLRFPCHQIKSEYEYELFRGMAEYYKYAERLGFQVLDAPPQTYAQTKHISVELQPQIEDDAALVSCAKLVNDSPFHLCLLTIILRRQWSAREAAAAIHKLAHIDKILLTDGASLPKIELYWDALPLRGGLFGYDVQGSGHRTRITFIAGERPKVKEKPGLVWEGNSLARCAIRQGRRIVWLDREQSSQTVNGPYRWYHSITSWLCPLLLLAFMAATVCGLIHILARWVIEHDLIRD